MRAQTRWSLVAALTLAALAGAARAQVSDPIQYSLLPGSNLEYGCFGPCACPIAISGPLTGDLTFYRTSVDPLFSHYALTNIRWTYTFGGGGPQDSLRTVHLSGHGTYDLGGEFALTQRMTLDLVSDDLQRQHFDSGLVPVRATFPAISIDLRVRVNACIDSILQVLMAPLGVASVEPLGALRLLRNVQPNPTSLAAAIILELAAPARTRVDVLDPSGRVVATLVDGELGAGARALHWDGRNASGEDAGPGVFWIRARAGSRVDQRRVVRLR